MNILFLPVNGKSPPVADNPKPVVIHTRRKRDRVKENRAAYQRARDNQRALQDRITSYTLVTANQTNRLERDSHPFDLQDMARIEPLLPYARRFCYKSGRELPPHSNLTLLRLVTLHGEERAISILKATATNDTTPDWIFTGTTDTKAMRNHAPAEFLFSCFHAIFYPRSGYDTPRQIEWEEALIRNQALLDIQVWMDESADNRRELLKLAELARRTLAIISPHHYKGMLAMFDEETNLYVAFLEDIPGTITRVRENLIGIVACILSSAAEDLIRAHGIDVTKRAELAKIRTPNVIEHAKAKFKGSTRLAMAGDRTGINAANALFEDAIAELDWGEDAMGEATLWQARVDISDIVDSKRKRATNRKRKQRALELARQREPLALLPLAATPNKLVMPNMQTTPATKDAN